MCVNEQLEHIRASVMADDVEIHLAPNDLAQIQVGGKDRLAASRRPGEDLTEWIDDAAATCD